MSKAISMEERYTMTERDFLIASTGGGMQNARECITAVRAATSPDNKVSHLTDAIDALLRHLEYIKSQEGMAQMNRQLGRF